MNCNNKGFVPKSLDLKGKVKFRNEKNFGLKKFHTSTSIIELSGEYSDKSSKYETIDFKDVVNALRNSSKGKLEYPENFYDESKEFCNLKYIGDLNHSSFSSFNTFRQRSSLSDEDDIESDDEDVNEQESPDKKSSLIKRPSDEYEDDEDLEVLNLQLMISDMQLRQERTLTKQMQILHHHDEYTSKLEEIRINAAKKLENERNLESERREEEIRRLEQLELAATHQALIAEEEYRQQSEQREREILKEIEILKNKEVERQLSIQRLREDVRHNFTTFINAFNITVETMKSHNVLSLGSQEKDHIESVCTFVETALNSEDGTNETELQEANSLIMDAMKFVDTLSLLLEQTKKQEELLANQGAIPDLKEIQSSSETVAQPQPENVQQTLKPSGLNNHLSKLQEKYVKRKELCELLAQQSSMIKEKPDMRPLLSRAIGILNQISNQNFDSSNRNALQQIMNLLGGRNCIIGNMSISIQNDHIAEAFVIEQMSVNLISLSHDKQVGALPVYASFIMKIWEHYPHVGELVLFKLFESCPFLVPLVVKKKENQSEAEYNRSLGFRHKDGGNQEAVDKYLNRMGACAQLYGRIVSMEIENHPHGIENGWKLMATTVSMPPMPSITTSILNGFISVAGNALIRSYGKQFKKILNFICSDYLSLIKVDMLEGGDSDVHSFTKLLEEYLKTGTIPPPKEGYRLLV